MWGRVWEGCAVCLSVCSFVCLDLSCSSSPALSRPALPTRPPPNLSLCPSFPPTQGAVTEFPSLRGPNGQRGKDSASKWRLMVERAVKIYVRR